MKFARFKKFSKVSMSLSSALLLTIALSGCGKDKADATKGFNQLKLGKLHGQTNEDQFSYSNAMRLRFVESGKENSSISHFSVNEAGTAKVKLDILDSSVTSATVILTPGSYPDGMTILASTSEANTWLIQWTPPASIFANQSQTDAQLDIQIEAHAKSADPRIDGGKATRTQAIVVTHTRTGPKFVSEIAPDKVKEGQKAVFTLTLANSSSSATGQPTLVIADFISSNSEDPHVNGRDRVTVDKGEAFSNGTYKFQLTFDATNTDTNKIVAVTDKTQPGVLYCFIVRAETSNVAFTDRPYCLRVLYVKQIPVVAWTKTDAAAKDTDPIDFTLGTEVVIKFKVTTATGDGNLVVKSTNNLAKWPSEITALKSGSPVLDCKPDSADTANQSCTLTWTPSCKATKAALPKTFDISVANQVGEKPVRPVGFPGRKLTFSKVADSCATTREGDVAPETAEPVPVKINAPVKKATVVKTKKPVVKKTVVTTDLTEGDK
jgi:hypothetical protein